MRRNYCSNCGQNLYGCYDDADQPCHACPPGDQAKIAEWKATGRMYDFQKFTGDTGEPPIPGNLLEDYEIRIVKKSPVKG